ncbi:PREDICTED: putative nuclease HARBI1 isoform X1 [Trachymyrmex cornetzi]|uniref:putative nuclease HARBI1 isoform X1 n=1 Tax=Trachymyrmex cornetzi TaxID=471704 RepID=UPI00084F175F|nr:PREDICTED: putative nuclease HARBI1 isoform X1 [Trachymyrmex cornetzi]
MPDVIGAIDGCHIEIEAPKFDAASYRTSKKKYAVQLQAICDASLVFTDCFAGYPGAVHDVRVLHNSPLYRDAMRNERALFPNGEYLVGDKGYQPVRTWLITPYRDTGALTQAHKDFNNILSRTRQVIERAFALLKGRFRRLKHLHMDLIDEIPCTILACCVLHNLCLQGFHDNEEDLQEYIRDGEEIDNDLYAQEQNLYEELVIHNDNNVTAGQRKRNYLKDRLT